MSDKSVILLVDDDEDSVVLLQNALDRADVGHRQVVARDGKEAIDYLSGSGTYAERKKFPWPALVLLDLKMPGVDGFGVLEWVRKSKRANGLAIVVMTASNNDSDRERALALGAAGYYVKPGSFTDLVRIAREIRERWLAATPEQRQRMIERMRERKAHQHHPAQDGAAHEGGAPP